MDFASLGVVTVVAITAICYGLGVVAKTCPKFTDSYIPALCCGSGAILGIVGMFTVPNFPASDPLTSLAVGIASGLAATGINQMVVKQPKKDD